jgi:ACS family tartrate transporter-like MFS transporter
VRGHLPTVADLEKTVMRKVAWRLVPLLSLCFMLNILDRFNVAVAALTMNDALGLSTTTYGLGAGAFFWSYTLFQIPANAALSRIGARRWLTAIVVLWGLCSMGTALATGVVSFVAARFLLGIAEAGFLPGVVYFMTCWFPSRFRGRAIGVFYAFGAFAGILIGPISANLLKLDGWLGIAGWQWVFLVEGLPSLTLAAFCPFALRDRPADASWLSKPERQWLEDRLHSERDTAVGAHLPVTRAIRNPQVVLLTIVALLGGCGFYSKSFFLPLILKTFELPDITIGYWLAVPQIAGIAGMLLFSRSSDRTGERVWHLVAPMLIGAFGLLLAGGCRRYQRALDNHRVHDRIPRHLRCAARLLEPAYSLSRCGSGGQRHRVHQFGRQHLGLRRAATRRPIARFDRFLPDADDGHGRAGRGRRHHRTLCRAAVAEALDLPRPDQDAQP